MTHTTILKQIQDASSRILDLFQDCRMRDMRD